MSTLEDRLHEDVEKLRQRRDELRVQMELGKMEAGDVWQKAEDRWQALEGKLRLLTSASKEGAADIGDAAAKLVEEIREAFSKIASRL